MGILKLQASSRFTRPRKINFEEAWKVIWNRIGSAKIEKKTNNNSFTNIFDNIKNSISTIVKFELIRFFLRLNYKLASLLLEDRRILNIIPKSVCVKIS